MTANPNVETIFALSSGAPPSGVVVIRLSGPDTRFVLETIAGTIPPERQARLRTIRDRNDSPVDSALVLFFPAPRSFTGEDCGELHLHGGRAVVRAVLELLASIAGCRQALAGEFTRRAFENGRLDLTEVEGLSDLIAAETDMQRRLAIEQAAGGLTRRYAQWAQRLTRARALIEAELDFAEEEDVSGAVSASVWADLAALAGEMDDHLDRSKAGEIIRDGFRVVIAGAPNAGKSSLLNALARREVAIVTEEAGTTRDVLSVDLDLQGYLVRLSDTAGLRHADNLAEAEGVRRAERAIAEADCVLALETGDAPAAALERMEDDRIVPVWSKSDRFARPAAHGDHLALSARTGAGMDELTAALMGRVSARAAFAGQAVPSRQRHRAHLKAATTALHTALEGAGVPLELRAEALRMAGDALGRITGSVAPDDLLGVIFSEFCIGK